MVLPVQNLAKRASTVGLTLLIIGGVVIATLWIRTRQLPEGTEGAHYGSAVGVVVLLILYFLYGVFAKTWKLSPLYLGEDGRPSTSIFQAFLWTLVAIFAYCSIYALRASAHQFDPIEVIPRNLLLAMGFSFTTLAAAKGITVAYVNSGRITKNAPQDEPTGVTREDGGKIDLTKVQMLAWTYIAIGVYLFRLYEFLDTWPRGASQSLPDIDAALMVLMGLSQGVYVGKKLVTADTPVLNPITPGSGPPGTVVTLTGASFGAAQGTNWVTLDGIAISPLTWEDAKITFKVPTAHPLNKPWVTKQQVAIDVIVNGRPSIAPVVFLVVLPEIRNVTPKPLKAGAPVTIDGMGFGSEAMAPRSVTIGGTIATATSWSDQQIVATVPAGTVSPAAIVVTVGTESSAPVDA